jgi:hypothetical protein
MTGEIPTPEGGRTTPRQVAYWRRSGLLSPDRGELAQTRTIAALRRAGMSVARIRAAADRWRTVPAPTCADTPAGAPSDTPTGPAGQRRFAVHGGELYVQHANGTWEGDRAPGQLVLDGILPLQPMDGGIRGDGGVDADLLARPPAAARRAAAPRAAARASLPATPTPSGEGTRALAADGPGSRPGPRPAGEPEPARREPESRPSSGSAPRPPSEPATRAAARRIAAGRTESDREMILRFVAREDSGAAAADGTGGTTG